MIRSEVRVTFFDEAGRYAMLDPFSELPRLEMLDFFDETNRPVALHLFKVRLFPLTDRADCWLFDVRDIERLDTR